MLARGFSDAAGTELLNGTADGWTIDGVGRAWISIGLTRHHGGSTPLLLNWRTGQATRPAALARDEVRDLDAASASRRLCSAIRRPPSPGALLRYRAPFAISRRATKGLQGSQLGRRAVAWVDGRTIHARSLRGSGAEKRWRGPLGKVVLGLAQVGPYVLVTIQGGPGGGADGFGFTTYRGRLPS